MTLGHLSGIVMPMNRSDNLSREKLSPGELSPDSEGSKLPSHVVAIAILYQDSPSYTSGEGRRAGGNPAQRCFLMQLRDDNPDILYPGHWAFFGGHLEPGETPRQGVLRELVEEIGYAPAEMTFVGRFDSAIAHRYVFAGALTVPIETLVLTEGQDLALVTPEEIAVGWAWSPRLQDKRPLGAPHQALLQGFIANPPEPLI